MRSTCKSHTWHHLNCFDLPALPASHASCFATHLHLSYSFLWSVWLHQCCFCYRWCLRWDLLLSSLPLAFHVGTYKGRIVFCSLLQALKAGGSKARPILPNISWCKWDLEFLWLCDGAKSFTGLINKCGTTENGLISSVIGQTRRTAS